VEELRLKSNVDLHKLWYVLLKEKNMLLTMEHACKEENEMFPNPERIDKVEDTMKNLEAVVRERNKAYYMLETGTSGERTGEEFENFLGLPEYRQHNEQPLTKDVNKDFLKEESEKPIFDESDKSWFLMRWKERQRKHTRALRRGMRKHVRDIMIRFPEVDRELLKRDYPDCRVEHMIEKMDGYHLGNDNRKTWRKNRG